MKRLPTSWGEALLNPPGLQDSVPSHRNIKRQGCMVSRVGKAWARVWHQEACISDLHESCTTWGLYKLFNSALAVQRLCPLC